MKRPKSPRFSNSQISASLTRISRKLSTSVNLSLPRLPSAIEKSFQMNFLFYFCLFQKKTSRTNPEKEPQLVALWSRRNSDEQTRSCAALLCVHRLQTQPGRSVSDLVSPASYWPVTKFPWAPGLRKRALRANFSTVPTLGICSPFFSSFLIFSSQADL